MFWLCYGNYNGKRDIRLFSKYLQANYRRRKRKTQFDFYVTDCLQNVNRIIAEHFTGSYMAVSYKEIVSPQKIETRTGEQIVDNIKRKLREIGAE